LNFFEKKFKIELDDWSFISAKYSRVGMQGPCLILVIKFFSTKNKSMTELEDCSHTSAYWFSSKQLVKIAL
jgi:hypothetical protein